jgi:integrase
MAVNFYLDNRTDKKGDAPIRMSVTIRGARYLTSTGYKIAPAKWDAARQQARRGCSNSNGVTYSAINSALAKITDYFTDFENRCITENIRPGVDALKTEFARHFGRKNKQVKETSSKTLTVLDYLDMFTAEMGAANQWTDGTRKKFAAFRNHLEEFNSKLSFADLTEKGLNAFVSFLREKKGMKNTTISKQIGLLKWFLRWATAKEHNTNRAFQSFSPKLKTAPKKVVFLEWAELMRVFNYSIPKNGTVVTLADAEGNEYEKTVHDAAGIEKTRDIFCFCCFTSLRYSDAVNLKRANISGGTMTITTVKTADTITIEINKYARSILDKYAARDDLRGYVFPSITNQRMNVYLKDLCELCGINEPITQTYYKGSERIDETAPKFELIGTHTGRRTFICNALMLGIPAEIVMKWTGHSDYKAMKPYIDITNAAKAKAMSLFNAL